MCVWDIHTKVGPQFFSLITNSFQKDKFHKVPTWHPPWYVCMRHTHQSRSPVFLSDYKFFSEREVSYSPHITPSLVCVYDLHHTKCLKVKVSKSFPEAPYWPKAQKPRCLPNWCAGCNASYVWQTTQHLATWLSEDKSRKGQVKDHFKQCKKDIDNDCF